MQFKHNHARPAVLRELSLLRALGASLRASSRRLGRLRRPSLPLGILPRVEPVALLPEALLLRLEPPGPIMPSVEPRTAGFDPKPL